MPDSNVWLGVTESQVKSVSSLLDETIAALDGAIATGHIQRLELIRAHLSQWQEQPVSIAN